MAGLFDTLYGKQTLFGALYSRQGADAPTKRTDIRLGDVASDPAKVSFFERDFAGIPVWLIGVFVMGFAYMHRKKRTAIKIKKSRKK